MRSVFSILLAIAACGQQAARVEFEVVSVKRGDPNDPGSSGRATAGRLEMRNATLKTIVRGAYGLHEYQLEGGPRWIETERFHIDGKFPAGSSREQGPLMIQAMLADRFHLQFHRETRDVRQYALVVSKGGPRVEPTAAGEPRRGSFSQGPRQLKGWGLTMPVLARMLIGVVGAPVVDRTGLTGEYNIVLAFASLSDPPRPDETLPGIFTVIQEQLGLKLEPIRGPIEVLVIDRVEMPSGN